jgi:hypothetical protein
MGDRAIRCRFPKTNLKAANLVPVSKAVGILRDAVDDDVEYLLYQFRSVRSIKNDKDKADPKTDHYSFDYRNRIMTLKTLITCGTNFISTSCILLVLKENVALLL